MEMKKFSFNQNPVYIKIINGKEYFLAKNICDILDLGNVAQALSRIEKESIILNDIPHPQNKNKKIQVCFVDESGLYELIFSSRKQESQNFRRWVFKDVLPQIRQTGSFVGKELPIDQQILILANQVIKDSEEKKQLICQNEHKQKIIDEFIKIDKQKTYSQVAKLLHINPQKFISYLKSNFFIREDREPYQEYIDRKYFVIKYFSKKYPSFLITETGFNFFRKRLYNNVNLLSL